MIRTQTILHLRLKLQTRLLVVFFQQQRSSCHSSIKIHLQSMFSSVTSMPGLGFGPSDPSHLWYTCRKSVISASASAGPLKLISFKQKDENIRAAPGVTVILPCKAADYESVKGVEWSREDLKEENVLLYRNNKIDPVNQHRSYNERVDLPMKDGNVSPEERDT
ncbi:hypothetical protein ILYODFUR_024914 [Ilyodon furcidens]|uniref:Immunoglobulin V-set domain-containing protein n=1 Tax=Ilyodon furcidens TaxID=33524 RepID=A0ABV0TZ55_9TELE